MPAIERSGRRGYENRYDPAAVSDWILQTGRRLAPSPEPQAPPGNPPVQTSAPCVARAPLRSPDRPTVELIEKAWGEAILPSLAVAHRVLGVEPELGAQIAE